jgi:hypothetical protein
MKLSHSTYAAVVIAWFLFAAGQTVKADKTYNSWSEKDLLKAGQALSVGTTLTSNLQMAPTYQVPPPLKTMQDFGFDTSKTIDQTALNNKAWSASTKYGLDAAWKYSVAPPLVRDPVAGYLGAAGTLVDFNFKMFNIWRVGTGRAEPDILKDIIPHVVLAYDIIKGPKNIPSQVFTTPLNQSFNDGSWKMQMQGTKIIHQEFSTTAPGTIGHYGFDPYTDRIVRQTSMQSIKIENFDGSRFNRMYQNAIPKIEPPKFYTPPIQMYQPRMVYVPPIQRYQSPVIYTPPKIYTPPRIYNPPPSYRR